MCKTYIYINICTNAKHFNEHTLRIKNKNKTLQFLAIARIGTGVVSSGKTVSIL